MKKLLCVLLSIATLFTCLFSLTACGEKEAIELYVPDGAPALSIANLLEEGVTLDGRPVNVTIGTGAEVKTALSGGKADIAILPTNACATLYNGGLDIKMLSVQTWGLLYLVGENVTSLDEIKGKTVCCIGQNDVPGTMFRNILDYHDVEYTENLDVPESDKINIKYYGEAKDFLPLLKTGNAKFGVLGEPAASQVIGAPCTEILDFQEEWKTMSGQTIKGYPQASMVLTKSIYENANLVGDLVAKLSANNDFIITNSARADELLTNAGSATATAQNLTSTVIARCNVNSLRAKNYINEIEAFLLALGVNNLPNKASFYLI